jgi:hypothetical protein
MNSAIHILYSSSHSIYQYRQYLTINPDVIFTYQRDLYKDDSIYIDIPDIQEIIFLSDIQIESGKYEIIADKRIVRDITSILVKKYKNITIRLYDILDYEKMVLSFNVTLAKKSIRSCL